MLIKESLLNECLDKIIGKKHVYSTVMHIENEDGWFLYLDRHQG